MLNDKALIVFAKSPVPGQVKTRLMPQFSAHQASIIHQQLLEFTVSTVRKLKAVDLQLHCAPDDQHPFFNYLKSIYRLPLFRQLEGDLGQRMSQALFNALLEYKKVLLIGSDAPSISISYLEQAYKALDNNDIVLGPAEDGGYVLVGLTRPQPMMFDQIDWGSERVLQQTIERLEPAFPVLLDTLWDVDLPEDVERFKKMLNRRYS